MYGVGRKHKNEKAGHSTSFFTVMYRKDETLYSNLLNARDTLTKIGYTVILWGGWGAIYHHCHKEPIKPLYSSLKVL